MRALGYGSLSSDGFFPQLHGDDLMLLPEEECGGLQTAYGRWWAATPPDSGPAPQACTGEAAAREAGEAALAHSRHARGLIRTHRGPQRP